MHSGSHETTAPAKRDWAAPSSLRLHASLRAAAFAGSLALAACASGPRVEPVQPSSGGDHTERVLYALPRALIAVNVPVTVTTFRATALTAMIGESAECTVQQRLDPSQECYWRFRSQDPGGDGALLSCSEGNVRKYLMLADSPAAIAVPVPDPEQIFAVDLVARGFQRLKVDLALSQSGAPSKLAFSASSPVTEIADLILSQSQTLEIRALGHGRGVPAFGSATPGSGRSPINEVVAKLAALEVAKIALMRQPGATASSFEQIAREQQRLRAMVEGTVTQESSVARLVFDPGSIRNLNSPIIVERPQIGSDAENQVGLDCGSGVVSRGEWKLQLRAQEGSRAYAQANQSSVAAPVGSGYRYRVPVWATASLMFDGCSSDRSKCAPSYHPIPGSLAIPQWGPTRALPRRVGIGEGAVESTIDPVTGALVAVGSEGDNGAALDAIKDFAQRLEPRPRVAPDELGTLERQVSICTARYQLGQPLEGECAGFRPPE